MVGADPTEVGQTGKASRAGRIGLIPLFSINICVTQGKLQTVCFLVSFVIQHPRASSAKTRGFHTQLDEGPETP